MSWIPRRQLYGELEQQWVDSASEITHEIADTKLEMATAFSVAIEASNHRIGFVEHSARVAMLVDELAKLLSVDESGRQDLKSAAQLHEIGMTAIPVELVENTARLDNDSVQRIRDQALISAEIARASQSARTVRLIEEQYTDFSEIRRRYPVASIEVLLAGVLHVADAFDAVTNPRPYQFDLPATGRLNLITAGQGTRFDPRAVEVLVELESKPPTTG